MARSDQHLGLPDSAIDFLLENRMPPNRCETCRHISNDYKHVIGVYKGMFDDIYPLYRYHLNNNDYADEFVQESPWSSGPCFLLGLRLNNGTEFTWTQKEINNLI